MITWGQLAKSQTDPEKIEEAIQRLINEHNADPEAHLVEGGSLKSHKMAEIIDHLVNSIVADKIKDFEIGREKLTLNKYYIRPALESLDHWLQAGTGVVLPFLGNFAIRSGSVSGDWKALYSKRAYLPTDWANKGAVYETILKIPVITYIDAFFGVGNFTIDVNELLSGIGFKVVDGNLYACWAREGEIWTLPISGVNLQKLHTYKAVNVPKQRIDFYIDDVLKVSAVENLPFECESEIFFEYYVKTRWASIRTIELLTVSYYEDK
jgi:hypothetical protein